MADSIGSQNFFRIHGKLPFQQYQLSDRTRAGVNGRAWKAMGVKSGEATLTTEVDVTDMATGEALGPTYAAMAGSIVSITMAGVTFTNYLILSGRLTNTQQMAGAIGGVTGGNVWVEGEFVVAYAGV